MWGERLRPITPRMTDTSNDSPTPSAPCEAPDPTPPPTGPNADERTMGMLAHLLAIPLGIFGPLIIWLMKKDESAFVNDQGKESLNFQLSVMIASFAMIFLMVVPVIGCLAMPLLIPCAVLLGIADLVLTIIGTIKANEGVQYRYPVNLRLIK